MISLWLTSDCLSSCWVRCSCSWFSTGCTLHISFPKARHLWSTSPTPQTQVVQNLTLCRIIIFLFTVLKLPSQVQPHHNYFHCLESIYLTSTSPAKQTRIRGWQQPSCLAGIERQITVQRNLPRFKVCLTRAKDFQLVMCKSGIPLASAFQGWMKSLDEISWRLRSTLYRNEWGENKAGFKSKWMIENSGWLWEYWSRVVGSWKLPFVKLKFLGREMWVVGIICCTTACSLTPTCP